LASKPPPEAESQENSKFSENAADSLLYQAMISNTRRVDRLQPRTCLSYRAQLLKSEQ